MLLDDTEIELTGRWAYHIDPVIPNQFHSFHATNHSRDFAALNFTGTSIQVFGLVGPRNGNYTVLLDGANMSFSGHAATTQQASLFCQGNLDSSKHHQLIITNEIEGHLLTLDLFNVTQFSSTTMSTPSPSAGLSQSAIIAIAIVATLCAIILTGGVAYLLRQRRKRRLSNEGQRLADASFRPRIPSIILPGEGSANMGEIYPWMREGNTTLG